MQIKKLFFGIGILTLIGLSACEDKNETVIVPEAESGALTFELFTPENEASFYTLLEEDADKVMEILSFNKPDYGFNAIPTYAIEVSLTSDFKTGHTIKLESTNQTESVKLITKELNSTILKLHLKGDYPPLTETQNVYIRIESEISKASAGVVTPTPIVKPIYSNSILLHVLPYEIKQIALPATYYLIGLGGKWDNKPENIGTQLIPLSMVPEYAYNPSNGKGTFVYTGYFNAADGFKILKTPGSWDNAWGLQDGQYVYGRGDNISVPKSGYYRITLNTEAQDLRIEPVEVDFIPFKWIEMVGDFSDWDATPIKMNTIETAPGSIWFADLVLTENSGLKFRADGNWTSSWGGESFPYGLKPSGNNIPAIAGEYRVVFNQIDNCYFFFPQ